MQAQSHKVATIPVTLVRTLTENSGYGLYSVFKYRDK
jgi:hypothetical protein